VKKPPRTEERLNFHVHCMMRSLGVEPGPRWWEASDLTTALRRTPLALHLPCQKKNKEVYVCKKNNGLPY